MSSWKFIVQNSRLLTFSPSLPVDSLKVPSTIRALVSEQDFNSLRSSHRSLLGIYQIALNWIPLSSQSGPNSFCAIAVDNTQMTSNQWCITFVVDSSAPDFILPSTSPTGIIFQNQTIFHIRGKHIRCAEVNVNVIARTYNVTCCLHAFQPHATFIDQRVSAVTFTSPTRLQTQLFKCLIVHRHQRSAIQILP